METLLQDVRYALRSLRRRPGFAAVVTLTLAIGIGANSAIFSVVNGVLLRPLPYRSPDELVVLWTKLPEFGREVTSLPDFRDWRDRNTTFSHLAALANTSFGLTGEGEPERVPAAAVTANFFQTLGVSPVLGRSFTPEEEREGRGSVVVLGHGLWQRRFGGRANVIGETVGLSGTPYTIVGVAPPGLRFTSAPELWVPQRTDNPNANRRADFLWVVGRLKPGVTLARAEDDVRTIMRRLEEEYPRSNAKVTADLVPIHEQFVGKVKPALMVFMGAVGLVLLIACANVANLTLARSAAREREIAVRAALGAGKGRIVRQLLTESVVLALAGAALGLVLATWGVAALQQANPSNLPRVDAIGIDGRVVAFTAAISLAVGLLFGVAPAARLSKQALSGSLRDGARSVAGGGGLRDVRGWLVMAEVAVAILLLAGAGLLVRSFERLQRVDVGFDPSNVLTAQLVLPQPRYPQMPQATAFFDRLVEQLRAAPGVRTVALGSHVPMTGGGSYITFWIDGRPEPAPGTNQDVQAYRVSPDYFRALGIKLVRGRTFTESDRDGTELVAVINAAMAKKYWPGQDPIGSRITFGDTLRTIVGVVADTRQEGVSTDPYAQAYTAVAQEPRRSAYVVLKTERDPMLAVGALKEAVKRLDRDVAVSGVATMQERIGTSLAAPRVNTVLLAIFAGVALVLASVGIYGVTSYAVSQRTREIGVRMALGAHPASVLRLVVRQGMTPVLAGLVLGVAGAFAATRYMQSLLYGVSATDPVTFAAIALVLTAVAFVAALVPARRASRVDPVLALRAD